MPNEIPIIYRLYETSEFGVSLHLRTDATNFWDIVKRHALNDLQMFYGGVYSYRVLGPDSWEQGQVPPVVANGILIRLSAQWPNEQDIERWEGRLAWETIGFNRLRVVYALTSDLPPNLSVAWTVLSTIRRVFPESRDQLANLESLIEQWAYDDKTRNWWRERVQERERWNSASENWKRQRLSMLHETSTIDSVSMGQDSVLPPDQILLHARSLPRGEDAWWHTIFSWYAEYINAGYRFSQRELADLCDYSLSHIKRKLSEWRAEHTQLDTKCHHLRPAGETN